jgi:hypothetical protein
MFGDIVASVLGIIIVCIWKLAIIWAPLLLGWLAFFLWHHFVSERFIGGIEWSMLEINVPREMQKTPLSMELFFTNALYHMSMKGVWETYWQGAVHFWYSLELVGIDGKVRFIIRVPSRLKKMVETQLYAQFPQVRVEEVEDYTLSIPRYRNEGNWYLWGCEFKLAKHDAYPIKTYKDYGLDKAGTKEEDKIDPITPIIEFLGNLERGEQVWIQIIVRQSEKKYVSEAHHGHKVGFVDSSQEELETMLAPYKRAQANDNDKGTFALDARVPEYLKDKVKAVKDKQKKLVFDILIRQICLADKRLVDVNIFNNTRRASRLLWRQYANPETNELARCNSTQYDSTFGDPTGKLIEKMKGRHLTYYKLRTCFYPPLLLSFTFPKPISYFFPSNPPNVFVMNTEELATIFHFPGLVSEAPSFKRIDSKTSKPPANLPF